VSTLAFVSALLVLGAATGFAAGLLGIGGGMLLVPFLTMLLTARGLPLEHVVHMALATSLATILFTSVSSLRAHDAHGAVRWDIVRPLAPGILLGSLIGAQIAGALPTAALALLFALFVSFSATQMLMDRKPATHRDLPGTAGLFGVGSGIGGFSSLVGAGGGFISVPFMLWCNVRMHQAVGTSAALGFPIAAAGTLGYVVAGLRETGIRTCSAATVPDCSVGFIYLPALLAVAAASMFFAPLGARAAHRLNSQSLSKIFAVLLYLLAGYMLYKGVNTL
jgi:uncharacterized membrane protein YfcA